jgi:CubicO group peptidase (beta-lactamase class C family)
MKRPLLTLFIALSYTVLFGQQFEKKIDSIIQTEFGDQDGPGGVFLITQKGKRVYEKAFGKANLELGLALSPNSVFQIGSMSKQFTAIAILMLDQQGKLKVNDAISKYIPDYPNGKSITIHQLLTHTSGIKDFTQMKSLSTIAQTEMTSKMMVDFFKNEPPSFKPAEKFAYNNAGYVILGYLIELLSGSTYENFITKNIFEKIGMTNSCYASDRKVIKNRAYGYHEKSDGYVNKTVISFSVPFSSGALMSTVGDMLKWQDALNHHILLNAEHTDMAFRKHKLPHGEEITYGYGWHLKDIEGTETREHGGSIFGFKSMGIYIPSADIYVLGFSNCDCHSPTQTVREMASYAFHELR